MTTVSELRDALDGLPDDMLVKRLTYAAEHDLELDGRWADLVVGEVEGVESLCFDDHEASRPGRSYTPLAEHGKGEQRCTR